MPKTLAALPRSQYPTDLDDASGHDFLAARVLSAGAEEEEEPILLPREPNGVGATRCVASCRMARTIGDEVEEGFDGRVCWCRHRRQTNGDAKDLPTTLRRPGRRIDILGRLPRGLLRLCVGEGNGRGFQKDGFGKFWSYLPECSYYLELRPHQAINSGVMGMIGSAATHTFRIVPPL